MAKNSMTITKKVILVMMAVTIPLLIAIAWLSYAQSEKLVTEEITERMKSDNELVEKEIKARFESKAQIPKLMSHLVSVKTLISSIDEREQLQGNPVYTRVNQMISNVKESNLDIDLVWIANRNQSYFIANNGYISDKLYDITKREWFPEANESTGVTYTNPYIDYASGKTTISIVQPIFEQNQRIGFAGIDVNLETLPDYLRGFEHDGHYFVLLTKNKKVIYDGSAQHAQWEEATLTGDITEKQYYVERRQIENLGWEIISFTPKVAALEVLEKYQLRSLLYWLAAIAIISLVLALLLNYLLRDLGKIQHALKTPNGTAHKVGLPLLRGDEIGSIARALVEKDEKIEQQLDELNYQAFYDKLTGMPNRAYIEEKIEEMMKEVEAKQEGLMIAFMDVDHFKYFNDSKGHAFGDKLLVSISERLATSVDPQVFLGRFGGDEFILLMPFQLDQRYAVVAFLRKVHQLFQYPFVIDGEAHFVTPSIGVSLFPEDSGNMNDLLSYADTALYESKEEGRNRYSFFDFRMKEKFERELLIEKGLEKAIDEGEFQVVFQPQLHQKKLLPTRMEALLRWNHPEWGFISPMEFIPIAERTGKIIEIGDWVIYESLRVFGEMKKEFPYLERVAVNICALQLKSPGFIDRLTRALATFGVSGNVLELEVTESVFIDETDEVMATLHRIKTLGVHIALDDFGTGYSSLSYLREMPIDVLKMDRSFINRMVQDKRLMTIVQSIVKLAHALHLEVVAEGVETKQQLGVLSLLDVELVQGYYYSYPLKEDELRTFLEMNV